MGTAGQSEQQSQSSSQGKTPEQTAALGQALEAFGPRIGAGQQSFPGERLAGFNPTQQAAQQGAGAFPDIFSADRNMPLFGSTGSALQGILSGETGADMLDPAMASSVFEQTRAAPMREEFARYGIPAIQEQFAGPNFQSSARAREVVRGGEQLQREIGQGRSQFLWDTEQSNRALQESRANRAQQGVSQGMQFGQLPTQEGQQRLAGLQGVFGFAQQGQQQQQAEINSVIDRFTEANRFMDPEDLGTLMGLLGLDFKTAQGASSGSSWNIGIS